MFEFWSSVMKIFISNSGSKTSAKFQVQDLVPSFNECYVKQLNFPKKKT
jgi:hypothetical protein